MQIPSICPMKPWGIGMNIYSPDDFCYGYPETNDPTKFVPDHEACSDEEILNHKAALEEWRNNDRS